MHRRNFLKFISTLSCQSILIGLGQSCLNSKKQALEYDVSSSNLEYYFQINLFGSPARWSLDSFLDPFKSKNVKSNEMIGTIVNDKKLDKYGFPTLEYYTHEIEGVNVPYLWGLPAYDQRGRFEFHHLLKNMLAFRGCDMKRDGHEFNNRKLVAPTPGELSLTGQISDLSDKPIPVVHLVGQELPSDIANSAFKAKYGTYSGTIKLGEHKVNHLFQQWFGGSQTSSEIDDIASDVLPKNIFKEYQRNTVKANKLIEKSFDDIYEHYQKSVRKYQSIIDKTFSKPIAKVNDFDNTSLKFPFYPKDGGRDWDLTWVFAKWRHEESILIGDWNKAFKKAKWDNFADQFAITEALVKFGVIQSSVIIPNAITEVYFDCLDFDSLETQGNKVISKSKPYRKDIIFEFDSHNTGSYLTLVANSYMQLILMGCLERFIGFLKESKINNKSLFDMSLIHVTSEFEREPATSQKGSEHGWNGHSSIFYSGLIDGPYVIGNVEVNSSQSMFKDSGTWGAGAPMKFLNGRKLEYGNISSSISSLIGFPTPTPNRESMVKIENNRIVPLTRECKNI